VHSNFKCEECHRLAVTAEGKLIEYAVHNESGVYAGNQSHAAYTPRCLDCHGGNGRYYNDSWIAKQAPPAIAFNESNYGSDYSAHKPLVEYAASYGTSFGENEACLACHTNYSIEFEFKRPEYFDFYINLSIFKINEIDGTNATIVLKNDSGAKHEFKAINQIKCESCHSDVWQAANHVEGADLYATNASHVSWQWYNSSLSYRDDPMHNVTCIYSEYGISYYTDYYDNITEFCTLSCHKPRINPSAIYPAIFQQTVHAAYRISCYNCHNSSIYTDAFYNKPLATWSTPDFNRIGGHDNIDDAVLAEKLFLHGETCISCKRDETKGGRYRTWTEPNNTMQSWNGFAWTDI
jgi:hypothetical protein